VAEQSNDTVDWTMKRVGAQYKEQINMMGGHSVPRTLQTANGHGSEVVGKQVEALNKDGIEISFQLILTHLFRDTSGRVIGVEVRQGYQFGKAESGVAKNIRALKGVVLASGGFSADLHFRAVQDPRLTSEYKSTNQPGATAEALIALLRIDAAPVQLDQIQLIPLTSPDDDGLGDGCGFIAGSGMAHGVLVDPKTPLSPADIRRLTSATPTAPNSLGGALSVPSRRGRSRNSTRSKRWAPNTTSIWPD
jgi:succinate dehydrogenase/fumarate reductase flavoprotein subunit